MLTHLSATGFRNLEPVELQLGPGRHLFLGANGAGKTSLLEAVYVLATTRSFRTPRVAECLRHGAAELHVAGETSGRQRLEVALAGGHRQRRVNGERTGLAEHLAALPVVAWSAGDGEVLSGPPAARRRFLDRGVIGLRPAALAVVSRYRHALDGKKRLLRAGSRADRLQLAAWSDLQAQAGAELAALRSAYVRQLTPRLAEVLAESGLGLPAVHLDYRPSPAESIAGAEALRQALDAAAPRELALQQPLLGPQRDDLVIRWDQGEGGERAVRRVASAGERKALGLALLLAQARVLAAAGVEVVMLLDDVDVELDPRRLAGMWSLLHSPQVLATSARPAVWETLQVDGAWRVAAGRVETAC